ncbi:hypothetical protein [Selenihalanaerobacter shriftii]|uniref:4 TMS phage holin, superfamily IV n=1 Tax=Selenihalanaerobacter shriftii TaxID=142842 RepID=A0A1T4K3B5_9FIRM|nr:hypothetical protein [Selenihalanaerobacter shriftii]SJZ36843.1 hypothetical protein SAMN02745118_00578 [Selenihalanaerobacter shriftii]
MFKVVLFPLVIYLATLSQNASLPLIVILGLAFLLVIIGIIAEPIFLPRFGNLVSSLMGTAFIMFSLWVTPLLVGEGSFTIELAIITGAILGIIEFTLHHIFILTDK